MRDYTETPERAQHGWMGRPTASGSALLDEVSTDLLRTIAEVLDIRSVFPRISEIATRVVRHDALVLQCADGAGHTTFEVSSPEDLSAEQWPARTEPGEPSIVTDLRRLRFRCADGDANGLDALIQAGYRSALTVRSAPSPVTRLTFLSKHGDAYSRQDLPAAQHIADYIALAVAHEQLATTERNRAEAQARAERLDTRLRAVVDHGEPLSGQRRMVGRSEVWQRALSRALRVAATDATVFVQGESGTGKELVARFIHEASPRKEGPFVAINCAALPEQLLESELFGYERGAFTGAHQTKVGQIELASRGVLFLDEVSEMSLVAQAKVLRVLQEREYQRLGGVRTQKANVRVVAASNSDLHQAVERGRFREDLLYRLQVFEIRLPALRERSSDIPLLAEHFLAHFAKAMGRRPARLADDAREALMGHNWPGNIRELRNVLESAAILTDDGIIDRRHLCLEAKAAAPGSPYDLGAIERQTIETALSRTDGNKAKTARLLGLTRSQLYVRLRRYGIERFRSV